MVCSFTGKPVPSETIQRLALCLSTPVREVTYCEGR